VASIVAADLVQYHAATQSDVDGSPSAARSTRSAARLHPGHRRRHRRGRLVERRRHDADADDRGAQGRRHRRLETKTLTGTTASSSRHRRRRPDPEGRAVRDLRRHGHRPQELRRRHLPGDPDRRARLLDGLPQGTLVDPVSTRQLLREDVLEEHERHERAPRREVSESADPSGTITHGLATAVNDSGTTTNRQTAPAGVTFAGTARTCPAPTSPPAPRSACG
jgi:hypothetical protein